MSKEQVILHYPRLMVSPPITALVFYTSRYHASRPFYQPSFLELSVVIANGSLITANNAENSDRTLKYLIVCYWVTLC